MGTSRLTVLLVILACTIEISIQEKEPSENELLVFIYSRLSHNLLVKTRTGLHQKCYYITLTDQERHDVHTDAGLKAIELKYITMLVAAKPVTADKLRNDDVRLCGTIKNGTVEYFSLLHS